MTQDILLTLAVIALAIGLFIWNRIRLDVVGLIVMTTLVLVGLVSAEEALQGFSNEAVVTVAAMFVLSSGLHRTGAIDLLGQQIARIAGASETKLLLVSVAMVIPLSAFVNNTPVVVVMIPVILGVLRQSGAAPSRIFMPVSFASQLGGSLTLVGTSTNLLVAGLVVELGLPRLRLFDITPPALALTAVGVLYLIFIAPRLLPIRLAPQDLVEAYELRDYLTVLQVLPDSPMAGRSLRDSGFGASVGLQILAIDRGGHRIARPDAGTTIEAGDILISEGKIADIAKVEEIEHLRIVGAQSSLDVLGQQEPEEPEEPQLAEMIVPPRSRIVGRSLRQVNFRRRYGAPVLGIQRHGASLHERLGNVRLRAGDILLVQGTSAELQQLHDSETLALLGAVRLPVRRTRKMKIAVAIMAGVILLAAFDVVPIMLGALFGSVAMFLTGCLQPDEAYEDIDWMVIILLGSILPLGVAMQTSGTAHLLGTQFVALTHWMGPYGALAAFYLMTSLLTEVVSNNAAALVLTPVAVASAVAIGVSPLPFVVAVMFAASNSFMTPVGYQTNTFIYAPGGYRFTDFLKVGAPLNVLMMVVATFAIPFFFPF